MFILIPQPKFTRKLKRLLKKNRALENAVRTTLALLAENPASPKLRTHKVTIEGKRVFSSSLNDDLRIIWRYQSTGLEVIDLLDVGGHEGSKKVYR
jgi:mRNA-degrading endonuclease YafQ of YafQ-DinJ toxin-antitoxin module